jgi:uncharacterized phage-like protein YoqJ
MIYAGTGHRPNKLGGYSKEVNRKLLDVARRNLEGCTTVISGMALGWDMALAHAARMEGIPFIAAVPFKGQERIWPKESQESYYDMLRAAKEVVYVCEEGYAPWKMQVRNQWMVDHCDVVLALWNGSSGGTGNCVEYADKVGKPIKNVWDDFV